MFFNVKEVLEIMLIAGLVILIPLVFIFLAVLKMMRTSSRESISNCKTLLSLGHERNAVHLLISGIVCPVPKLYLTQRAVVIVQLDDLIERIQIVRGVSAGYGTAFCEMLDVLDKASETLKMLFFETQEENRLSTEVDRSITQINFVVKTCKECLVRLNRYQKSFL